MNNNLSNSVDCMIRAKDGNVGKVEQFYFDDLTWIIRYMTVKAVRELPGHNYLIPVAALGKPDWEKRVIPVNCTIAQMRSSPNINSDAPISHQHEIELQQHYAWPGYWGGNFYVPPGYETATFPANDTESAVETPLVGMRKVDPHLRSTRDITGCQVLAKEGNMGQVDDFVFDDETWGIRYLLVGTRNWRPNRHILVSPQWIRQVNWTDKKVFVDFSRDAIKKSPKFDPTKPVSLDYEGKLREHLKKPEVKEWIVFKFHAPPGTKIYVAGTFNNWDSTSIKLGHHGKGTYTAMILLSPGKYEYKFIVNGEWRNGPEGSEQVPNAFGTTNSTLVVGHPTTHEVHPHTFARLPDSESHRLWSVAVGG